MQWTASHGRLIAMSPSPIIALRRGAAALCLSGALFAGTAASAAPAPESFAPLVNRVKPAVVNIATTTLSKAGNKSDGGEGELPQMPNFPPGSPFSELFRNM